METLRRHVDQIKGNQDILNDVVKNLIHRITNVEKKVDIEQENKAPIKEYIEEAILKVSKDIEKINDEIHILESKEKESLDTIKKCYHFNKGFCRRKQGCPYYHPETFCEQFENEGMCVKLVCRDRHQRICKYWKRGGCFRGETCEFSHRDTRNELKRNVRVLELTTCDNCNGATSQVY
jgi:hypothetical protein